MSAISSISGISFSGLASGIDSQKLVEGLMAVQQSRVTALQRQQATLTSNQTLFQTLQAQVFDLQTAVGRLGRSFGGAFDGRTVTSSDETIVKATAGSAAIAGVYSIQVTQLAEAHQVASVGLTDLSTSLKTGTLTIQVGSGTAINITVDSSNNTLQGLATSINNANGDVTASVINDGTGTPYRLLLAAKKTGASNQIQITNNLTEGSGAALDLNPATQTIQVARDAQILLGSGATALSISNASNKVDNLIPGVTLDLQQASVGKTVTLTVSNDISGAKKGITDFVDSYNKIMDFLTEQSRFDAQTNKAGPLLGNSDAANLEYALTSALGSVVDGVNQQANRLSALGITFSETGKLLINTSKLDSVLNGQVSGVTLKDVKNLFALNGTSNHAAVNFVLGGRNTKPTTTNPIEVFVTQAAEQANLTASNALAESVVVNADNRQLNLKINGKSGSILLSQGTYDAAALAREVQNQLNGSSSFANAQFEVKIQDGKLSINSRNYGASNSIEIEGGSAMTDLGFTSGQKASGKDVVGKFRVNGVEETATGSGQLLIGSSGNAHTDGLQLRVTLSSSQLSADPNTIPVAQMTVTRGLAASLDVTLNQFLDPVNGRFETIKKNYQSQMDDLNSTISRQNTLIEAQRERLLLRFAKMEAAVSKLQSMGNVMGMQIATMISSKK
jgi:flagellar hook-associated protein 2